MKDFNKLSLNNFCESALEKKNDEMMDSKKLLENQKLNFDENGQNITLQVNGKEEEKYLINNSSKLNNKLSYSCLDLNELNLPNSAQLSLNSLNSETCIHAEAGKLFHKQLGKELNKVIPSMQKKMSCMESISNKFNKKEKYNPSHLTNLKQFDDNLENCFLINEPLISNNNNLYDQKNQFETNSNSTPTSNTTASSKLTNSKSIQSIFVGQSNFLKPPCSRATTASVAPSLNKIGNSIYPLSSCNKNRISFIDSSHLNIKTDLTPTNLRRRCIAKNGVANIRNAKISRKSQRFFLDFFNTMIDIEWHFNLLTFALSFVFSWLFFAVIWWCIAYQHGDLYRIDEFEEVAVDLDKMDMNLNFLTENIENLNPQNVLGKTKRSTSAVLIEFQDQDEILNSLALSILNNRTTVQQLIEHFKLSKLKLNSTSGTNIYNKMYDGTNLTQFLSYAKNNPNLKQTFALHNVSLNKIAKLVQPKRIFLNDSNTRLIELNEIKQLNDNGKSSLTNSDLQLDQSLIMNTVTSNEEHFPQFPVANLTLEQRNQLENLFYLMQLQTLLQQERHKQQIAKFLTKLAQKNKHHGFQSKPLHPPLVPPPHPLPLHSSSAIEASEEQNQKELEAKQKEQEKKEQQRCKLEKQEKQKIINDLLNKQNQSLSIQLNSSFIIPDDREIRQNTDIGSLPSTDAVIDAAVQKASETVMPKCGVNGTKACRKTCLDNINSFTDAILFSIETQHTIGYGTRQPTDECKIVLIVLMIQSIFGCLIQCFVVGFVFAKLSRPQNRHQTLIFSKRALINLSEYDQMYDYLGDGHIENQFNLNFEELNDLVKLMKTGEMQDIIQDCGCTSSDTSSNQNCDDNRRSSEGALSNADDDLIRLQNNNILDNFLDGQNTNNQKDLLNNFLNIPPGLTSKRCSNVSFLNTNLSSLRSNSINKPYVNLGVNHCCELEQNIDYTGNKNYRLEFRIGDVREKSHIINAKISAYFLSKENYYFKNDLLPKSNKFMNQLFLRKRRSEMDYSNLKLNSTINTTKTCNYNELLMEKKLHNFTQKKLPLTIDNVEHSDGELLLIWPIVVSHEINERSPLYNISREEMMNSKFEIVIVLEGTIESTGQSVQARTSYLPNEILWGEKFLPILQSDHEDSEFLVNFSMFNMTKSQNMPNFSSRDYQIRKKFHKLCILKKCLAKLSDTELDEQNSDLNNLNNSNLLRHLITKNDKYNLNGLINNMDDLNNLNNLLITLNKLVNNNNNKNLNQNNFGNNFINNNISSNYGNFNNSQNSNHFYQPSISIDQNEFNRKKSLEINQLYGLLNSQTKAKDPNSKSINYLNNILISNQHDQLNKTNLKKDAEHITIEDDFLNSNSQERKKSSTLLGLNKLMNLFHTNQSNVSNDLEKNFSSQENKKKLIEVKENNLINSIDFDLKNKNMFHHKDDSYLNAKNNSNMDWQFNSDWNLASAYRKRQFIKEKNQFKNNY